MTQIKHVWFVEVLPIEIMEKAFDSKVFQSIFIQILRQKNLRQTNETFFNTNRNTCVCWKNSNPKDGIM